MKKLILVVILILFFNISFSRYKQVCKASYKTESGWSKKYTVEITFMTGLELNQATNSFRYSSYSVYAIIFWDQGQATIIKLSSYLVCGTEATKDCITNTIGDLKGKDQDEDEWKICINTYCF